MSTIDKIKALPAGRVLSMRDTSGAFTNLIYKTDELIEMANKVESLAAENKVLREAIPLRDCIECGVCGFEASPINKSEGFCWNCHKLLTITGEPK